MPQPAFITAQFLVSVAVILIVVHIVLITVAYLIYLERKISAYIQDRIGPNRVGFDFGLPALKPLRGMLGLGQPLADGLKFLLKEDYQPNGADRALFTLAPMASIAPALIGFVVIPWGGQWTVPSFEIPILGWHIAEQTVVVAGANVSAGVIYLLAVASLGVYGVTLGGWASNSKFSFFGGLRATAQMLAYEIPLGLSLLAALLLLGTVAPAAIVDHQVSHGWLIFSQPLAAVIFFIAILAEANRAPFDNAEAESELVGGYHTEYSSMRFALFFLAEYAHMITSCAFFTLIFLGGWDVIPFIQILPTESAGLVGFGIVLLKFGVFFGKVVTLICFMMVIRWTLPRLRFDQVMMMSWQGVIPLSLALVVMTAVMVYLDLRGIVPMLLANAALAAVVVIVQGLIPRRVPNKAIPLYGSRFRPMPGERVATAPSDPLARADHPVAGTST